MSTRGAIAECLDAIDAQLEILTGVFERLVAIRIDLERGSTAIAAARLQIVAVRREVGESG